MEVDVKKLAPPTEEEWQWMERMADMDDDFPGQSGIVAYRMRLRGEAAERRSRFEKARNKFHKRSRPRAEAEAA